MTDNEIIQAFEKKGLTEQDATTAVRVFNTIWEAAKTIGALISARISAYPNKRVKHLAIHAKKKRTRKKNLNRAKREIFGGIQ